LVKDQVIVILGSRGRLETRSMDQLEGLERVNVSGEQL
jgi:hypothetical protein